MKKDYTIEEVKEGINSTFTPTYVATDEGQAHLNRVGNSYSNASIELRKVTNKHKKAEAEFNKVATKLASTAPEQLTGFLAGKNGWISDHIAKKLS